MLMREQHPSRNAVTPRCGLLERHWPYQWLKFKKGEIHHATTNDLVFHKHRIQLDRVGDSRRSIYLAGTPPPAAGRSVAASAYPAQLPFHRAVNAGSRRRVTRSAAAFAHPAAFGDIIAAILALVSLLLLPRAAGVAVAWIFNLWGSADLFNAFYQANHAGLLAGQLGAAFFLPTLIVPLLLITHVLVFRILLQHQPEPAMQESRHLA